jgi:hypothetical protein
MFPIMHRAVRGKNFPSTRMFSEENAPKDRIVKKKLLLVLIISALLPSCGKARSSDPLIDLLILDQLMGSNLPGAGTGIWRAPAYGPGTLGACQHLNVGSPTSDYCYVNYPECQCHGLDGTYAGDAVKFSTATGSTSMSTTDNLCIDSGYTHCTYVSTPLLNFIMCGPNDIAAASAGGSHFFRSAQNTFKR